MYTPIDPFVAVVVEIGTPRCAMAAFCFAAWAADCLF